MSLPDEPVTRRPVFLPVLIAAVCLSIIGASFGYVLSAEPPAKPDTSTAAAEASDPAGYVSANPSAPVSPPSAVIPSSSPTTKPLKSASKAPTGPVPCPERTQNSVRALDGDAVGTVYQRIRLKTQQGTIAYICASDKGRLFYHGARTDDEAGWRNDENALFLTQVTQQGDAYVAEVWEADESLTTVTVSPKQWVLKKTGQEAVVETAAG